MIVAILLTRFDMRSMEGESLPKPCKELGAFAQGILPPYPGPQNSCYLDLK